MNPLHFEISGFQIVSRVALAFVVLFISWIIIRLESGIAVTPIKSTGGRIVLVLMIAALAMAQTEGMRFWVYILNYEQTLSGTKQLIFYFSHAFVLTYFMQTIYLLIRNNALPPFRNRIVFLAIISFLIFNFERSLHRRYLRDVPSTGIDVSPQPGPM